MPHSRAERLAPAAIDASAPETTADLARLHALCFPEDPWSAAAIAGLAADPGCDTLALENGETLAGFALVRSAADEAELLTICVSPAWRGRGAGRALMQAACDAAAARGAQKLFLEVAADNWAALALYRACGCVQVGLRKNYYDKGRPSPADACILCCPLSGSTAGKSTSG